MTIADSDAPAQLLVLGRFTRHNTMGPVPGYLLVDAGSADFAKQKGRIASAISDNGFSEVRAAAGSFMAVTASLRERRLPKVERIEIRGSSTREGVAFDVLFVVKGGYEWRSSDTFAEAAECPAAVIESDGVVIKVGRFAYDDIVRQSGKDLASSDVLSVIIEALRDQLWGVGIAQRIAAGGLEQRVASRPAAPNGGP
ncbi:hypothetical protein [Dolichospermum phage Dfl-JY45]